MEYLWGSLMFVIGVFMFLGGVYKSEWVIYRLLHARAKVLWGDYAHSFLMISGLIITLLGFLFFFHS